VEGFANADVICLLL